MDDLSALKTRFVDPAKRMGSALTSKFKKLEKKQQLAVIGVASVIALFVTYYMSRVISDTLFVLAELVHLCGVGILILKLRNKRSAAGLSLRSQELTVIFLGVRFLCSLQMEKDIHTLLDLLTLIATGGTIYVVRAKLMHTYSRKDDNLRLEYAVVPCVVLALLIHPSGSHHFLNRVLWAFAVYLEAVSILPQLKLMQNMKVITELFAAHYVFALGCSRFLSFSHWIFQFLIDWSSAYHSMGKGLWPLFVLLAEFIQTAIFADFCYYYIRSVIRGDTVIKLPV